MNLLVSICFVILTISVSITLVRQIIIIIYTIKNKDKLDKTINKKTEEITSNMEHYNKEVLKKIKEFDELDIYELIKHKINKIIKYEFNKQVMKKEPIFIISNNEIEIFTKEEKIIDEIEKYSENRYMSFEKLIENIKKINNKRYILHLQENGDMLFYRDISNDYLK